MQIYRFKKSDGKEISQYDSKFVMSRILSADTKLHISCMYLEAGGIVGYHDAVVPQLLLVMEGEAFVKGEGASKRRVCSGLAVFWGEGEGHETYSADGMTAIVIEGKELAPEKYMVEEKPE